MCPAGYKFLDNLDYNIVFDALTTGANQQIILPKDPERVMVIIAAGNSQFFIGAASPAGPCWYYNFSPVGNQVYVPFTIENFGPAVKEKVVIQVSTINIPVRVYDVRTPKGYSDGTTQY